MRLRCAARKTLKVTQLATITPATETQQQQQQLQQPQPSTLPTETTSNHHHPLATQIMQPSKHIHSPFDKLYVLMYFAQAQRNITQIQPSFFFRVLLIPFVCCLSWVKLLVRCRLCC